ncbi:MAG TPA: hypothetical protein VM243_01090 [Phycisphaerae bacterium]|nr:hypothetical protein [Phycisphaerae bacterium]
MIKCYVVAEGRTDVTVLSALLAGVVPSETVKIVDAGGQSSAVSLASTFLATRSASVALVADADTTAKQRVGEMQMELEDLLGSVAPRQRFGVFLAVPSLEVCLFEDQVGLQNEFGCALSVEAIVQSRYEPKAVLEQLLRGRHQRYDSAAQASLLARLDLDRLRQAPVIEALVQFISRAVHDGSD